MGDTVFHRKKLGLYQVPDKGKPLKDLKYRSDVN